MDNCKRWNVVSVPVEEPAQDNRDESYKIAGSKEDWGDLHKKIRHVDTVSKSEQIQLVDQLAGDCTIRLNKQRVSLGLVEPAEIMDVYIDENPDNTVQMDLEMNERKGKSDYPQDLYIKYRCEGCAAKTYHDQHTIEWGVYRYWDKHDDVNGVIDALGFNDDNMNHYFFVGNLNHEREAYIIISVLRFSDEDMLDAGVTPQGQGALSRWD
ncbi:hypothetical protein [Haloarcula marismortui]|uniref:Uncharacterized protein n=1 Tax=Haloarcula marismortui ATCC 33799 TaxID=662475 RepID=M0JQR1_9EURY|nr:hypothetical protein [Haloarcula californiae]EMA09980.1 hypothetical protein C435_20985 [Haloarcula californiae ATCC 33799]